MTMVEDHDNALLEEAAELVAASPVPPMLERRVLVALEHRGRSPAARTAHRWPLGLAAGLVLALGAALLWRLAPEPVGQVRAPAAVAAPAAPAVASSAAPWLVVNGERRLEVMAGTFLALGGTSRVTVRETGERRAVFGLEAGGVVAVIGPHAPGFSLTIVLPDGVELEARGTVFGVEVAEGGAWLRVVEGTVEVRGLPEGDGILVAAGEAFELVTRNVSALTVDEATRCRDLVRETAPVGRAPAGDPPRAEGSRPTVATAATTTPADELALAQALRRERRFAEAREVYERLALQGDETGINALVPLGQMELTALRDPQAAIGRFDTYLRLAPGGWLAEAARVGRLRSLVALGRCVEAGRELELTGRDFPEAIAGFRLGELLARCGASAGGRP